MESPMERILESRRASGLAMIVAIGTANPPNCFYQSTYPDLYFKLTNSDHLTELKQKFRRICERTTIKKRYMYLTEDIINKNPEIATYGASSLDARQKILIPEVPKLGKEAALKAIKEWGHPISKITHLIFCTSSGVNMPGADHQLVKLLGLQPSVKRFMIYHTGCFAGAASLRLAKDIAENNGDSRVLIVEWMSASFGNMKDWNKLFYIVHPGGPTILNSVEEKLGLEKQKLRASRHVLSEYGNMWSPCVFFILDEMRKTSMEEGKATTGEGLDLGILLGFGPGLTLESVILRSVIIARD